MRILVVGAGAIGGYFGGRLSDAGRDVTFLVRAKRREQLERTGLSIRSSRGNVGLVPQMIGADQLQAAYDLIILSCKSYDLDDAIRSFAPAVGPQTVVLPLLNGMRHLDTLVKEFGEARVLGGQCAISATLDEDGRIIHLNDTHSLSFGARSGKRPVEALATEAALVGAGFDARLSDNVLMDMWSKWVFIATTAGITCLMRSTIGDIVAAGAGHLAAALLEECASVAESQGYPIPEQALGRSRSMVTSAGSALAASMLRDIENGARTEVDHVLGDLLGRGGDRQLPLLEAACAHVQTYEARRRRLAA